MYILRCTKGDFFTIKKYMQKIVITLDAKKNKICKVSGSKLGCVPRISYLLGVDFGRLTPPWPSPRAGLPVDGLINRAGGTSCTQSSECTTARMIKNWLKWGTYPVPSWRQPELLLAIPPYIWKEGVKKKSSSFTLKELSLNAIMAPLLLFWFILHTVPSLFS